LCLSLCPFYVSVYLSACPSFYPSISSISSILSSSWRCKNETLLWDTCKISSWRCKTEAILRDFLQKWKLKL
jgi:hypothetical protein